MKDYKRLTSKGDIIVLPNNDFRPLYRRLQDLEQKIEDGTLVDKTKLHYVLKYNEWSALWEIFELNLQTAERYVIQKFAKNDKAEAEKRLAELKEERDDE